MSMSKSLLLRLAIALTPSLALALSAGLLFGELAPLPKTVALVSVFLASMGYGVFVLHRIAMTPLNALRDTLVELRAGSGPLPKNLPLHRSDEVGQLAREIALLAGERNASELRRAEGESKNEALIDAIPDAMFRIDQDGLILDYEPPKELSFFVTRDQALGRNLKMVFPEAIVDSVVDSLAQVFISDTAQQFSFRLEVEGEPRSFDARFARSGNSEVLVIVRDTTRQKQTATSRQRLNAILDATIDPIVTVTPAGDVRYINPAGRDLLGIEGPRPARLHVRDFLPEWAQKQLFETAMPVAIDEGTWNGESALVTTDDTEIPVSLSAVAHRTEEGDVELLSFIVRDQSERQRFDDHLTFLADHDPLTSLYTRRRFVEELGREIARAKRSGAGGAVLLLDLDDFKYVNESLGHRTGDRLLTTLAQVLRKEVRANDMLARLDGDEFAVLVTETPPSRVDFIVERLLKSIRNHFVNEGEQPIGVTGSVGVAFFPEHGASAEDLLARADQALDTAKRRGRDQFVVYKHDESWQARVDSRLSGEKLIRDALARGRFVLHAQPILDLKANEVVQFELLIRMLNERDELVPPASFLGTAERFGLIRSIDRWVVRQAIELLGRERKKGNLLRVSVNLSGKSLADLELTTFIETELAEQGVEPHQLTLEVTEHAAITDIERAKIFAFAIKQIGCRLALDDFGVGSSSFNHLKHLPVDYLKIDGSFIRDLPKNAIDQHLVKAMVEVSRALRKRTVAEFVSSPEILKMVRDSGVDFAQGFHIGKPDSIQTLLVQPAQKTERAAN
jgi:diguanylate cyclase (GGDEF)-like protein/PAS domain S-box-containing protein